MQCNVFGLQFQGNHTKGRVRLKLFGPDAEVLVGELINDLNYTAYYHPAATFAPITNELQIPAVARKGVYTVQYSFTDDLSTQSKTVEAKFEVTVIVRFRQARMVREPVRITCENVGHRKASATRDVEAILARKPCVEKIDQDARVKRVVHFMGELTTGWPCSFGSPGPRMIWLAHTRIVNRQFLLDGV